MNELDALLRRSLGAADVPWQRTTLRRAAVLAPIVRHDGEDALLFVVRPQTMRQHAGQIAFPGGADDDDEGPAACALREAAEEIGIAASCVDLLGSLPSRTSSSNFRVHCLVGRLAPDAAFAFDAREVERPLFVPLRLLLDASRWTDQTWPPGEDDAGRPKSPHFVHEGERIWGLTGRLCQDLLLHLRPA